MLLLFLRDSWPPCEVAFINIIELPWENISCLRFLPNRNIFYDTRSSHKQKHVFVLVSIGRKAKQSAFCAWAYFCSDTINSRVSGTLKCLTKVNLKKWAAGNYVLPLLENCHCAFPLV